MKPARTIFIWDIHGCYDEFQLLLEKLSLQEDDLVYILWDMINKWPKSWKTLKFIYKNRHQFKAIKGNHELAFLEYLEKRKIGIYKNNDFKKLEKKLEKHPQILQYLKDLPLYIEHENHIILHAGIPPKKSPIESSPWELTSLREYKGKPWYEYYTGEKTIIYGHWALDGLRIRSNTIWLDSWCVYGRALSAYILESWEIIQQQSLNLYVNVYQNAD